jgi:hypothetical protein
VQEALARWLTEEAIAVLAVGLPEPYFMVPDNSLLQDIRRASEEERRFPRYVAIEGFAYFLRNYTKLNTRIVITSTIFFESIGMRELRNEYEYREILYQFRDDLKPLALPIMTSGINNYKDARRLCSLIIRDARSIAKMFRDIKNSEWDVP